MAAAPTVRTGRKRNAALKDRQLVYRACTLGYARNLQLGSPDQLVGQTDADILSEESAHLIHQAEQRVLATGIPEVTDGRHLSARLQGLVFLRSPVLSRHDEITGVEINVVNQQEFQHSYQALFASNLQYRSLLNKTPFGLLVHRDFETLYQNTQWTRLVTSGSSYQMTAEELRLMLQSRSLHRSNRGTKKGFEDQSDGETLAITTIERDGYLLSLSSHEVRWNDQPATVVFCVENNLAVGNESEQIDSGSNEFIEKRRGVRRDAKVNLPGETQTQEVNVDAEIFNALKHPVFVCDNWIPLHANQAAQFFLAQVHDEVPAENDSDYLSIESWFTEREKADIETMIRQRELVDAPISVSLHLQSQRYLASISPTVWRGRSAILVSMQIETAHQRELDGLGGQLRKLEDFAAAAGDFFWEMDNEQCLTDVSMNLQPLLGIDNTAVVGVPLESIVEKHVHPEDMAEWSGLMVDMRNHVSFRDREYKWQHRDGEKRVVRLSGVPVFDDEKHFVGYRGIGSDFTAAYGDASMIAYHASHDSLTGLVNRREFENRCDEAISSVRSSQVSHALCFMDLDNFKIVNDTCGHAAGDELLRQLSALFSGLVRKSDVLARLGGDEFGVLIFNVGLPEAIRLANQLRAEVESFQFLWEDNRFAIGASIGVVIIDDRWESRSSLFGAADQACYEAKNLGRNRVAVYKDSGYNADINSGEKRWVDKVTSAIDEKRIRLSMQKIISLDSYDTSVTNVELLMRMMSPSGEIISPSAFLPAADRYGLSVKLDQVVIEQAIDWLEGQPHVTESMELCAINLNGRSFADEDFTQFLLSALKKANFDVSILCFEIKETAAIANLTAATLFMKRVGDLGCQFALDDFGSGLSSFAYLKNLPVKYLKIDGMFVKDILEDSMDFAMVKAINEIGQTLGKKTIAEFVESDDVLLKLRDMGVNLAQGYHIGKPEIIDF